MPGGDGTGPYGFGPGVGCGFGWGPRRRIAQSRAVEFQKLQAALAELKEKLSKIEQGLNELRDKEDS